MRYPPTINDVQQAFSEFNIIRQIGRGGHKTVFEVTRISDGEHLVLKIINPKAEIERVQREIQAMLAIESPFVAKVAEFQQQISATGGVTFLLEEFIPGLTLAEDLSSKGRYEIEPAVQLLDKTLQGLVACNAKSIVHLDIKPGNIMIRPNGAPVIIDFGIARLLEETSLTPTAVHQRVCTLPYAPPEVLDYQKRQISGRSDLFSLGVTAYIILTGQHPLWVMGDRDDVNVGRMKNDDPKPLTDIIPSIPHSLSRFVLRLMNRKLHKRFKNAAVARERLRQVASEIGVKL